MRHEDTHCPNHPETQSCGKPSRRLLIQNEKSGSQLQTQTDDFAFTSTNGTAHRAGLERMCQVLDADPVGQLGYRSLNVHRNGRRTENGGVQLARQIESANLSQLD